MRFHPKFHPHLKSKAVRTALLKNGVFIAKPEYLLKRMNPEDEDIKQLNNIDKYAYCPKQLHNMCLADFVAKTDIVKKYTPIKSDDEQSINEYSSEEKDKTERNENINKYPTKKMNENRKNDDIRDLFPIQLSFNKTLKLRKKKSY